MTQGFPPRKSSLTPTLASLALLASLMQAHLLSVSYKSRGRNLLWEQDSTFCFCVRRSVFFQPSFRLYLWLHWKICSKISRKKVKLFHDHYVYRSLPFWARDPIQFFLFKTSGCAMLSMKVQCVSMIRQEEIPSEISYLSSIMKCKSALLLSAE